MKPQLNISLTYADYAEGVQELSVEEQFKLIETILANLRNKLPGLGNPEIPNSTTIQAMEKAKKGKGKKYQTVTEMFEDLEV